MSTNGFFWKRLGYWSGMAEQLAAIVNASTLNPQVIRQVICAYHSTLRTSSPLDEASICRSFELVCPKVFQA
ncbi:MAG: hypothetical protein KME27_05385 [Lyngbya sp. HA4199-MV5]|nr:hypothetical protein [Lyngbya sp. HA4199-MV5]